MRIHICDVRFECVLFILFCSLKTRNAPRWLFFTTIIIIIRTTALCLERDSVLDVTTRLKVEGVNHPSSAAGNVPFELHDDIFMYVYHIA